MSRLNLDSFGSRDVRADRLRGVYLGIVTANTDNGGDSKYQVKLKFPWLPSSSGQEETHFARIAIPMSGAARGSYFLPEVDDQVLVVFEHGFIEKPIVIGALWSAKQKPPEKNADGQNNFRVIKSRAGHRMIFDDTQGAERVILVDKSKKNKILLDSANKTVTIETADGDIEITAKAAVRMHGKDVNVTTSGAIQGKGGMKLTIATKATINVKASGTLKIQAANIQMNGG
ncbi:MAG TPA: phage baseplate assembly protein V [Haliangium sp.]|nr:phage baseplate assembly protein V [Haliangium sp.]